MGQQEVAENKSRYNRGDAKYGGQEQAIDKIPLHRLHPGEPSNRHQNRERSPSFRRKDSPLMLRFLQAASQVRRKLPLRQERSVSKRTCFMIKSRGLR